ncbi:hypothetical protein ABZU76_16585 [Amycolatopsis sp. NPDC005232]|uniref:hypothetical protein n=1 Tax=Amycolatopsis sp. NPDC005232 TaxID=3157027 RepID=UPI0033A46EDA
MTIGPGPLPWRHVWVGDEEAEHGGKRREGTGAWFAHAGEAALVRGFRVAFFKFWVTAAEHGA